MNGSVGKRNLIEVGYGLFLAAVVLFGLWRTQQAAVEIHDQADRIELLMEADRDTCESRQQILNVLRVVLLDDPDLSPVMRDLVESSLAPLDC